MLDTTGKYKVPCWPLHVLPLGNNAPSQSYLLNWGNLCHRKNQLFQEDQKIRLDLEFVKHEQHFQSIHSNDHTIIAELQKLEQRINQQWVDTVGNGLNELKVLYQEFVVKTELRKIELDAEMARQRDLVLRVQQEMKADFDAVNAQMA